MQKLETILSRNGNRVYSLNGKLLASKIDPVKEAMSWFRHHEQRCQAVKSVFILGLGCGYHLSCFSKIDKLTELVCLYFSPELKVEIENGNIKLPENIKLVWVSDFEFLKQNLLVRRVLKSSYSVLVHPSATVENAELSVKCKELLIGREKSSQDFLLSARGELNGSIWSALQELIV